MIKLERHYNILSIRKEWKSICLDNKGISPIQQYKYYWYLSLSFYYKHLFTRWRIVFNLLRDKHNICIIPLIVNKHRFLIKGFSHFGRLDYEDIISSTDDTSFVKNCLEVVLDGYKGYTLHLKNINEHSTLYKAFGYKMTYIENCVTIDLPSSFDDYIAGLSKHQRQNIRSAYNRLSKDSFDICLRQYDESTNIPNRLWRQCQQMYERRHYATGARSKKWVERQSNPYTHILHTALGWQVFVLFHDEIPISYMAGLVSKEQNCYYVPRLCIDPDFNKYSPGIILLVETIRLFIGQGIGHLDLMLGDEPYKMAMGGRIHHNYELKCKVEELLG